MRGSHRIPTTLLALVLAASAAPASPFYLTAKLGESSLHETFGSVHTQRVDGDLDTWSLAFGAELGRFLDVQAEYHDLGSTTEAAGSPCGDPRVLCIQIVVPIEADSDAVSLSALPKLPLGERFTLFAKLGVVETSTDLSEIFAQRRLIASDDERGLLWGGGVRYRLPGGFRLVAEYESLADRFEGVSVGASFAF